MSVRIGVGAFPLVFAAWALAVPATAQPVTVPTPTETCFVADQYPQITLAIAPADAVKAARIYFHSALGSSFYYVEAQRQGDRFVSILPKPQLQAGPVTYYAEALDEAFTPFLTRHVEAQVVQHSDECDPQALAAVANPPGALVVFGGAGVPAGFTGMAGAAVASGGGGLGAFLTSRTGIIVSSAIVAGGVATAIVVTRDDDEEPASGSR